MQLDNDIYLVGLRGNSGSDAVGRQQSNLFIGQAQEGTAGVMNGWVLFRETIGRVSIYS